MTISYAITACNEHVELERLLDQLQNFIRNEDEIILQLDTNATEEVKLIAEKYNIFSNGEYHRIFFGLNGDFATFKNNLKNHCTRDYIVFIDADEYFDEFTLKTLPQVLMVNPDVDCLLIPRINTVEGITDEHVQKWGWVLDKKGRINYPDYQTRICKNNKEIKWDGKVHERLIGWKHQSLLPAYNEWSLIHPKTIERQEKQNSFYNTL